MSWVIIDTVLGLALICFYIFSIFLAQFCRSLTRKNRRSISPKKF